MDSRAGCVRMARLVSLLVGMLLAWPVGASAVTVTVGRQDLSTPSTTNFGCTVPSNGSSCRQTVSPSALSAPGDRAVVPGDGAVTAWRFVGIGSEISLRVLRPSGVQYTYVSHSPDATQGNGTPITLSPALRVAAGDRLGVDTRGFGSGNFARVDAISALGAAYNVFFGIYGVPDGATLSPTSMGQDVEPLFNADVVLDPPVLSSISPASGSTIGGQTVTINGDHLTGASQVKFGGAAASSFSAVSNSRVTAVTPPSAAGTVDVSVTTVGGTSAASAAGRFTFVDAAAPAAASFRGSRSTITVSRNRRFKFVFHGAAGLTGTAVFKSLREVRTSSTRKVTLARKSFTVPASGKVMLTIRLTKRKFRILRLNHKIRARVTVTLENSAGLTSTASKRITLKSPPPQR